MAVAIAAFTFTACEDVPEPYNNPYNGNKGSEPEVVIEPAGSGTAEDPWNVAALLEKTAEAGLGDGEFLNSGSEVYVKGIVTETAEVSVQYGNATYYISDDAKGSNRFYVYRGKLLDGASVTAETDLEVGDEVTVCGKVKNYKGTMEFDQGNYLVSLKKGEGGGSGEKPEVKTVGTKDEPKTVTEALSAINAMADGATSEEFWFVKGKVVKVTTTAANFDQYKNLNYLISEDGTDNNTITVYAGNGLDNAQFSGVDALKAGDEVVVYGQIQKYVNKSGAMTPEIAKGNYLVKYTAAGGNDNPGGESGKGTADSPYSVTDALAAGSGTGVYVKAFIVGSVSGQVLSTGAAFSATSDTQTNILIAASADETDVTKCMPVQLPSGAVRTALNLKDNAGNYKKEVTLYGNIEKYFGATGLKTVTFAILDGKEIGNNPGGGNNNPSGEAKGSGTQADPYNVIAAIAAATNGTDEVYVKGIISQAPTYKEQYGSLTYYISDDGKQANELQIYSGLSFNSEKFTSADQLKIGDEIIVVGKLKIFNNQAEMDKNNYVYSLNGKTSANGNDTATGYKAVSTIANGNYVIGATVGSNVIVAAPLASDKTYGYLQKVEVTPSNGTFETDATNEFKFTSVDGGYTIQSPDGRYLYMKGTYNSFNVDATAPSEGHVWTVSFGSDNTVSIKNVLTGKTIQYSTQYNSYGAYSDITNTLPILYKK